MVFRKIKNSLAALVLTTALTGCATIHQNYSNLPPLPKRYQLYEIPKNCKDAQAFYKWKINEAVKEADDYLNLTNKTKERLDQMIDGKPEDYVFSRAEAQELAYYGLVISGAIIEMIALDKDTDKLKVYVEKICEMEQSQSNALVFK